MNVAYILNAAVIGGGNRSMENTWHGLKRTAIKPFAVCPSEGPMWDLIQHTGIPGAVLDRQQPGWSEPVQSFKYFMKWHVLMKNNRIAMVHANDLFGARSVAAAARINKIPVLCQLRFDQSHSICRWAFRALPKPAGFIFVSQELKERVGPFLKESCPKSKQFVVYNGVDINRFPFHQIGNRVPRVGIIANLWKVKGHEDFLDMAAILCRGKKEIQFDIIGDDMENSGRMEELKTYARKLGIREKVCFHGHIADVPDVVKKLNVVVCASHYEPLGRCLIEAMACGKPVVTTRVGGTQEIVVQDVTGMLVPAHSPESLAKEVGKLLDDFRIQKEMGLKGRQRAEAVFSTEAHLKSMMDVYSGILSREIQIA